MDHVSKDPSETQVDCHSIPTQTLHVHPTKIPTKLDTNALSLLSNGLVDNVDVALDSTTSEGGREGDVLPTHCERSLDALCRKRVSVRIRVITLNGTHAPSDPWRC